jgi:hypothetical protein
MRRGRSRGQSVNAARCGLLSTVALLGCAATQGTVRATLAFLWVVLLMTALALEWTARRRAREAAPPPPPARGRPARKAPPGRARPARRR